MRKPYPQYFILLLCAATFALLSSCKTGLIAHYTFNGNVTDVTGNGHDGVSHGLVSTTDRHGNANSAYYFDGATSYVSVSDSKPLHLNNTDFTINTWVKMENYNASSGSFILSKRTTGTADGWGSSVTGYSVQNGVGVTGLAFFGPGGLDPFGVNTKKIALNIWYMVTTVYNLKKQQASFYINGILDNTVSNIPSPSAAIVASMYIGRDNPESSSNGYFLNGALDDIRIYSRALNATQIQHLYTDNY